MNWKRGILQHPVPQGGFGRNLTQVECQRLRDWHRIKLSPRWIVVRAYDSPLAGILYYPSRQGSGYDHAGIYVTD